MADRAIQDLLASTWPLNPRYSFHIGFAVIWGTSGTVIQSIMALCARQHTSDYSVNTDYLGALLSCRL